MPAYRLSSPLERPPLRRRASGIALAVAVNLGLLLLLIGIGKFTPGEHKPATALVVDLIPAAERAAPPAHQAQPKPVAKPVPPATTQPVPRPPPIILPAKPTIAQPPPPSPWIEMSKNDLASSDISKLARSGSGASGDSEAVGRAPNGDVLYAAEWARHPTDAELSGYLPANAPDGYGLVACKTLPDDRVDDCVELENSPAGSHLASAVRQAAWQFRVRPPRKNGRPLIGSWVRIEIDYTVYRRNSGI